MGALRGCMKCLKYSTIFFNFIVFLAGLFFVGFGGYMFFQAAHYRNQITSDYGIEVTNGFPIAVMVLGVIIFFVGFLGCCGACYESPCLLITFAATVAILLCLQIAVAIFAVVYKDEMSNILSKWMEEIFSSPNTATRRMIERDLTCCGFKMPDPTCGVSMLIYPTCWNAINNIIRSYTVIIIAIGSGLCLLQIAAIIVACCLQSKIRNPNN